MIAAFATQLDEATKQTLSQDNPLEQFHGQMIQVAEVADIFAFLCRVKKQSGSMGVYDVSFVETRQLSFVYTFCTQTKDTAQTVFQSSLDKTEFIETLPVRGSVAPVIC